jgi:hypothetical protein
MPHSISPSSLAGRRIVAAFVAALVSVAAGLSVASGVASATWSPHPLAYNGNCDRGEFCLARLTGGNGGMFDSPGSDDKLSEHRFYRNGPIVNDNTWSVKNNGIAAARSSVLVYNGYLRYASIGWDPGLIGCVRYGTKPSWKPLPSDVRDKISSYKWVTDAQCRQARQL